MIVFGSWFQSLTVGGRKDCLKQSLEAQIDVKLFVIGEVRLVDRWTGHRTFCA